MSEHCSIKHFVKWNSKWNEISFWMKTLYKMKFSNIDSHKGIESNFRGNEKIIYCKYTDLSVKTSYWNAIHWSRHEHDWIIKINQLTNWNIFIMLLSIIIILLLYYLLNRIQFSHAIWCLSLSDDFFHFWNESFAKFPFPNMKWIYFFLPTKLK